jgi:glycosyltransferase involved in cell wall biosynthesis
MKILMLDKNFLIDRRILLEASSLRAAGHEVEILAGNMPSGFDAVLPPDDQFTHRIDLQPPPINQVDAKLRQKADRGEANRFELMLLFVIRPDVAVDAIPSSRLPGIIKVPALFVFSILAAILRFVTPKPHPCLPKGTQPLDWWDRGAIDLAIEKLRPDAVQANDLPTLKAACVIAAKLNVPVVYDAHELYAFQPGVSPAAARIMIDEEKALSPRLSAIIVINREQASVMQDYLGDRNFVVCANATNPPSGFQVGHRDMRLREAIGLKPGDEVMLFQGGVNRARRIDLLLKGLAHAKSKHVHVAFLTFGSVSEFESLADELGIRHRVHFLPLVPWDDVVLWASGADCGVLPYQATDLNTKISSPNKMYEFIQAGTPMIASSELVNVSKVVGGLGLGVLLPLTYPTDYAALIDKMFAPEHGGASRFRPAVAAVAADFTWDREVAGVVSLYDQLARDQANQTKSSAAKV